MTRRLATLVGTAAVVVALDQWTKRWATELLAHRAPIEVIGDFVRFSYTRNPGIAFGLGAGTHFPFYVFSVVAVVAILVMFARQPEQSHARRFALALILGGAIGNLIDRVLSGEVVDFIELSWRRWHFPIFNVADSAVTIGVLLFALTWSRTHEPGSEALDGQPEPPDAAVAGDGVERGGAVGSIPRSGADGPLA